MAKRRVVPSLSIHASGVLVFAALAGCGARPAAPVSAERPPRPAPVMRDVFHDVFLRGGVVAPGTPPRVALTFDGLGTCAGPLLTRLRAPADGAPPMTATFFLSDPALEVEQAGAPEATRAALRRLAAEGHGVGLAVHALPTSWRQTPSEFRAGLVRSVQRLTKVLADGEGPEPTSPLVWRGPVEEGPLLGWGAVVDRPQVYWSLHVDLSRTSPEAIEGELATTARDGDVIHLALAGTTSAAAGGALSGNDARCSAVDGIPAVARGLKAAGLAVVPLHALLAPELARYEVPRVARFDGPGLSAACRSALGLPTAGPDDATTERRPRYGLWLGTTGGRARILPLPGAAASLPAFLSGERAAASTLWARRGEWRGLPACLVEVDEARQLSPLTPDGRLYVVGPEGVFRRDARALGAPARPAVLPTRADLVRLEARQRLPWRLRGLVSQTLAGLSLETPTLIEARSSVGVVVGAHLAPGTDHDAGRLREAIAGYVQISELSLGEYLLLARLSPGDAEALGRAARAADGFLRAGPGLVLRGAPGDAPRPARLGVTGATGDPDTPSFDPTALMGRALSAGVSLSPGDVLVRAPAPATGGALDATGAPAGGGRGAVRRTLARAVVRGASSPTFLRPGTPVRAEADLLGALEFRVVVPPGVHLPAAGGGRDAPTDRADRTQAP
jgi:2-keto-4-pentenoate hydratase/2-oxohepta-3-ene-1,7-dioic acid hydratase in catechol pathway